MTVVLNEIAGNTNIYRITRQRVYELKVDLEDFDGNTSYALYKIFSVASEDDYFKLTVGQYSGSAGKTMILKQ